VALVRPARLVVATCTRLQRCERHPLPRRGRTITDRAWGLNRSTARAHPPSSAANPRPMASFCADASAGVLGRFHGSDTVIAGDGWRSPHRVSADTARAADRRRVSRGASGSMLDERQNGHAPTLSTRMDLFYASPLPFPSAAPRRPRCRRSRRVRIPAARCRALGAACEPVESRDTFNGEETPTQSSTAIGKV
jgi:hypothetical protein